MHHLESVAGAYQLQGPGRRCFPSHCCRLTKMAVLTVLWPVAIGALMTRQTTC